MNIPRPLTKSVHSDDIFHRDGKNIGKSIFPYEYFHDSTQKIMFMTHIKSEYDHIFMNIPR